jgi:hypothetical protein
MHTQARSHEEKTMSFMEALKEQRWDDHRFYHHSRINQSLHFISAIAFVCMYGLLFFKPASAALVGWLVAMVTRQSGHFFFEPKDYDAVNQVTHEYKEKIKVGYNLRRKAILHAIWFACPLLLWWQPALFGLFAPHQAFAGFMNHLGQMWIALGVGALLFRVVQLIFIRDVQTALVWLTKILTDPFHDIQLYHRAPLQLMRGEFLDHARTAREERVS